MARASLPGVLWLVLVATLVGAWLFLQSYERDALEVRLEVTSRQVAHRLDDFLEAHVARIEALAVQAARDGAPDEQAFRELSRRHQADHPGLQALNWIDADGTIVWAEPRADNQRAQGINVAAHPFAGDTFRVSMASDAVGVTPPIELVQGGWGFVTYCRVRHGGETVGFLNGVFRFHTVLEHCLVSAEDRELAYELRAGDDVLGAFGATGEDTGPLEGRAESSAPVSVAGRDMRLAVAAPARWVASQGAWTDEALLAFALLLAGGLAWMVHVAADRERRARRVADELQVLVENAPDAIVTLDPQTGNFLTGNRRAFKLFGLGQAELRSTGPGDLSPGLQTDLRDSGPAFRERVAEAVSGGAPEFSWTFEASDGRSFPADVQLVQLPGPEGAVRASITDTTERHALEARLRQSEALEAMGRLAGGVAHDFSNMLAAALGACELLYTRCKDDARSQQLAQVASDACIRAGKLTHQLQAFSRHHVLCPTRLDLDAIIGDVSSVLHGVLGERVQLVTELAGDLPPVLMDAAQCELVLLNLVINARDAMPDGGRIVLGTEAAGESVVISVRDEGTGIAEADLARIFEPFFTTKQPGAGTGIGLATVKRIVDQAGGEIDVDSRVGEGTTFRVCLPVAQGIAEEQAPRPPRAPRPGSGILLLVEDDESVRKIMSEELRSAGYLVLLAADAEGALHLVGDQSGDIDLLVTDVVLPGMDGVSLAEQLQQRHPGLATLFVSGYSEQETDLTRLDLGPVELMQKPFSPFELTDRVGEMLRLV